MYSKLAFRKRQRPADDFDIPEDDLVEISDGERLKVTRSTEKELPRQVTVTYLDYDADYMQGAQYSRRLTGTAESTMQVEVPIVLDADEAKLVSQVALYSAWLERQSYEFSVGPKWQHIEPTDCGMVTCDGIVHTLRIATKTEDPDGSVKFTAVAADTTIYESGEPGVPLPKYNQIIATIVQQQPVALQLTPYTYGGMNGGFYWYPKPPPGVKALATLYRLSNGLQVGGSSGNVVIGGTLDPLPPPIGENYGLIDTNNVLRVRMRNGALSSITIAQLRDYENLAAVGKEIIAFATATDLGNGEYELTGFLRGLYGTEWAGSHDYAGQDFVLLNGAVVFSKDAESDIWTEVDYRLLSAGQNFESGTDVTITDDGESRKPLSPVHVYGGKNSAGDILITWDARFRGPVIDEFQDQLSEPINESVEAYEVDVWAAGSPSEVVRTLSTNTEVVTYAVADQTTDFGAPQTTVLVSVYQVNASGLRGRAAEVYIQVE